MPEMSSKFIPKHKGDKNPNPKLLKLVRAITDRVPGKLKGITTDDPEYWGYACIFEDEMDSVTREAALDFLLAILSKKALTVRELHAYPELLALNEKKKFTPDGESFDRLLDLLAEFGLVEYDYGDKYTKDGPIPGTTYERKDRRYWVPLFVPGSAEYTNMNLALMEKHPELAMFFERMTFLPLEKITPMVPMGGAGIGMHVIPVEKAISMENGTLDIEHISYWLKRYEGHISAGLCSCRLGRKQLDEGCADDFNDWCLGVGDMADFCAETGRGRLISYDEAMEILRRAEDNGFVHQVTNIDGEGKIFAICNCNVKVCNALRTSQLFNTPNLSRSAYVAHVEKENCVACGNCVEHCPAGALKLGQKLCDASGNEKWYPRQQLPDAVKWGKDKWTEDYRDRNRVNCHASGTSPCKTACPAHVPVQGYLKKASQGKYEEALELIKRENPFPAVCGRICSHPCEDACTRGTVDSPVNIDGVKKFIAELDLHAETRFVPKPVIASNRGKWKEKIAVIGAGPSGLSCAFFLAKMGYRPTVFEKNEKPGGMLRYGIPSYKLEKDVIDAEIDVIREMGVEIRCGVEVGKDVTLSQLRYQGYKAFYVAIGCQGGKMPGIPGENAEGVVSAVEFLRRANTGEEKVSGRVVVIGGGNVAIDASRVSARSGAEHVSLFCLEDRDIMPAIRQEIADAEADGVEIRNGWGPKEILTENGRVKGVVFKKCVSVYSQSGKFSPVYDEDRTVTVECDTVISAIGQTVEWKNLLEGNEVELHRGIWPMADPVTYQTGRRDIFVGGDVYTRPKFVIDAIACGHVAAESLHRFVQRGHLTIGRNLREYRELNKKDISLLSYDTAGRQEASDREGGEPFADLHGTLTEEQVKTETARCLGCGVTVVDPNRCIGCGICTTKCEFDAIHLLRDHPEASEMIRSEDKFGKILPYMLKRSAKIVFGKKEKT